MHHDKFKLMCGDMAPTVELLQFITHLMEQFALHESMRRPVVGVKMLNKSPDAFSRYYPFNSASGT